MAAKHWKYHEQSGFMDHNGQHRHQFNILKKISNFQKKISDFFGLPLGVDGVPLISAPSTKFKNCFGSPTSNHHPSQHVELQLNRASSLVNLIPRLDILAAHFQNRRIL